MILLDSFMEVLLCQSLALFAVYLSLEVLKNSFKKLSSMTAEEILEVGSTDGHEPHMSFSKYGLRLAVTNVRCD